MLTVTIDTSNAAFDDCCATETSRILRDLAARMEDGSCSGLDRGNLYDANGNRVGAWEWAIQREERFVRILPIG
jgi:hypothetical protein